MKVKIDSTQRDLAIFAHELRQPLSSILMAAQCLDEILGLESSAREMCQIVERQSRFLVCMIEDVLEQRQGSADGLQLRKEKFDLSPVIADAIEATGSLLKARASRLTVSLPQEQLWINADPLRVQQILINLLTNAAKYTRHGGRIQLVAEVAAGSIVIEVRDDGVGIPEALLPRVFDLFERGAGLAGNLPAGWGIGLALVKRLVQLHNGTITAHSDGSGKGATFVVRLPEPTQYVPETSPYRWISDTHRPLSRHAEPDAMCDA